MNSRGWNGRWVIVITAVATVLAVGMAVAAVARAQEGAWQTYTSDDAAYSFDYPPGTHLTASDDASLRFKIVYAEFDITGTTDYQGVSVMVLENPNNLTIQRFIAAQYRAAGLRATAQAQRGVAMQINSRPALKLQRDSVIGNLDKYTVLIPGAGVMYRINLYGGGVGGEIEPGQPVEAGFNRLVKSFRVLPQPLKPKQALAAHAPVAEPPVATVFTFPLRSGAGVNYGVPERVINDGTHMEWLGYAIRNLDQWGVKCYGVDWTRMLHTGEDWYRLDGADTAGAPVYAIADGVVAKQDPGISYPGNVIVIRHRLADGSDIYSMYGHVANVSVAEGQIVQRGQQIATVIYQRYTGRSPARHAAYDSHLHFEMRRFLDGTNIYVPGTNAYDYNYPACTYAYPGRGYTYIIHPDNYPYPGQGYVGPTAFILAHSGQTPPGCTPVELVVNGGFENGLPGAPWTVANSANKNDPLIYEYLPHTGRWGGWLGNVVNYTDTLAQVVNVPAGVKKLALTFWLQVVSAEPPGSANDRMAALLSSSQGQAIGAPFIVTSAAARNVWAQQTATYDVTAYAGQPVTLSFTGFNDAASASSFFIDDVSLMTQCP